MVFKAPSWSLHRRWLQTTAKVDITHNYENWRGMQDDGGAGVHEKLRHK